ncbi:hypothetical protein BJ166DRAFT_509635 [Pestalotiopsis sp. NC0098]|nr:hypothetical protein BJ166DRAFT_509635 [Pestalotiopsis sp. NC0098]
MIVITAAFLAVAVLLHVEKDMLISVSTTAVSYISNNMSHLYTATIETYRQLIAKIDAHYNPPATPTPRFQWPAYGRWEGGL